MRTQSHADIRSWTCYIVLFNALTFDERVLSLLDLPTLEYLMWLVHANLDLVLPTLQAFAISSTTLPKFLPENKLNRPSAALSMPLVTDNSALKLPS